MHAAWNTTPSKPTIGGETVVANTSFDGLVTAAHERVKRVVRVELT